MYLDNKTIAIKTATTTVIATSGATIHSVNCPKALTGTATFQNAAGTELFVLPIGSIGCFIIDATYSGGVSCVTSAADTVIISTSNR